MTQQLVIYWDTSAVVSTLFIDEHTELAEQNLHLDAVHFLSSLALAETHAVIHRLRRERVLANILIDAALETLAEGPWRALRTVPGESEIKTIARKYCLNGADLWHLSLVKTMRSHLPEIKILTFDGRLQGAAKDCGLAI
ncbi:MAG: PIN domain-containing protein [Bacillota bacterium]